MFLFFSQLRKTVFEFNFRLRPHCFAILSMQHFVVISNKSALVIIKGYVESKLVSPVEFSEREFLQYINKDASFVFIDNFNIMLVYGRI